MIKILQYVFVVLVVSAFFPRCASANFPISEDNIWDDYDNYIVINEDVTWRGTVTYNDIWKPVVIVDGATVTIEKGTRVEILDLEVLYGRIVAQGTKDEPIIFTKANPDYSQYSENEKMYYEFCTSAPRGVVGFYDESFYEGNESSIFNYVKIENMGSYDYEDIEICSSVTSFNIFKSFVQTAKAQEAPRIIRENPAVEFGSGKVRIENSDFLNNKYADVVVGNYYYENNRGDLIEIVSSNFEGNLQNTALISSSSRYDINTKEYIHNKNIAKLENNWYGNSVGPRQKPNYDIGGEIIKGDYVLNGFSPSKFGVDYASNVLFLPGLKASRLYAKDDPSCLLVNCENQLWEPNRNADVEKLFLNKEGESTDEYDIYTRDVLDETNILPVGQINYYKSFIAKMNDLKNKDKMINDWIAAPYDWRLSLNDVLTSGKKDGDNISYNKETDSPYTISELRRLASSSKTGKVTIVAHSNGGLVAKALMQKLGSEEAKNLVDKIIFVAVPQVGTPAAIAALLHGEKQNLFPVLSTKTARSLGENMPGAYNLLPSNEYFSKVQTPVVKFNTGLLSDLKDNYSGEINSNEGLMDFLRDDFRKVLAVNSDVDIPARSNVNLLENSKNTHNSLDSWNVPEGVKVIQIAGWGVPATLSGIDYSVEKTRYCDAGSCFSGADVLDPDFKFTIDGDGTVVTPSALWMSGVEKYWFDLDSYNIFLLRNAEHANILEIPELNSFIADNIGNKAKPISDYEYFSSEVPSASDEKRLQYSLHSPLSFELCDNDNEENCTGINPDGEIKEQIPGTYFKQFGDVKYIFTNENISSKIKMKGYDTGTFTFAVEEFRGDESLGKVTFKDMPVTPETKVTFNVADDLQSASNLEIDEDGNGTIDFDLKPKIGEIVTLDQSPPVTTSSIEGTHGNNDWYISDVKISLSAKDNDEGSGLEKTEFSLDDGKTWKVYSDSITLTAEGVFEIQYFSTDKQGNTEEAQKVAVKIDKTAPEAKLIFNAKTQELDVIGSDNLSQNVSVEIKEQIVFIDNKQSSKKNKFWNWGWLQKKKEKKIIDTATLTDEAGHKTEIVWEKKKDKSRRIDLSLSSISYDGNKTEISNGNLQYKWLQDWRRKKFLLFASHLSTESMSLESHYFPNKNQTWFMEKPNEIGDDDRDDNADRRPVWKKMTGMIIPSILTEKGIIKINY
ncbi:MAG TPA: hypothetical protein DEA43_00195 [Candidatus Moranbacteria bacterium]|nr:hypothetical protein [Candidatus Moranbacteria bacterium]HBT45291.1 hypothetical protein [Candidatus Moranbacteria bacterium]